MPDVSLMKARIQRSVDRLQDADRNNPNTKLSPEQLKMNPFYDPGGNNGWVDKKEAEKTGANGALDPFDKSVFDVVKAQHKESYDVSFFKLTQFSNYIGLFLDEQSGGTGQITDEQMKALETSLPAFFSSNRIPVPPDDVIAAMAGIIRHAQTEIPEGD